MIANNVRIFSNKVWVFFFTFTSMFIAITTYFITKRINNHTDPKISTIETVFRQFEYVFKIITNQGMSRFFKKCTHLSSVIEFYL